MNYSPRMSTVVLSRGCNFGKVIHARPGQPWPIGADVQMRFLGTTGSVLGTVDAAVNADMIRFEALSPSGVPAGARFDVILTTTEGDKYMLEYGVVIRKEPWYSA